ncbi:MAG TPA: helix-turn-helix domain-containing protein [Dermatophilaceae bacterium]|nr:helix-turn-helix domain-containing protein [Dermatophilaceae bacterium]
MKRSYRQSERARQAEETGVRILQETRRLFEAQGYAGLTLASVAEAAGVTTQTVIRRFGDKEGLTAAAGQRVAQEIYAQRDEAPAGDLAAIVRNLVEHYETRGPVSLRLLADEHLSEAVASFTRAGRDFHHGWCERVFAPWLADLDGSTSRRRVAQLVAICDVRTWELLRHREGLTPAQTRTALLELLRPLTEGARQ